MTVMVIGEVLALPTVLVAATVKVYVPALVGVPASRPADVMDNPDGSAPLATLNVMGPVPDAAKV